MKFFTGYLLKKTKEMKQSLSIFLLCATMFFAGNVLFHTMPLEAQAPASVEAKQTSRQTSDFIYREFEEFIKVVKSLQEKYVEELDINTIFTNAYRGMLSELDPFSQYISPEELEELRIETEGEFEGLGIEVIVRNGILTVITPILDSPAFKAGILVGDRIVKVDGISTKEISIREAIKMLRGKPGTTTTLTVLHEGETTPVDITIQRAKIHVNSIRGAKIVDEDHKIGYLALINFQENTVEDMDKAVKELLKQGMEGLILDLRFNPGGLLSSAVSVSDRFLKKGVIVSTRGRDADQNVLYRAHRRDTYAAFPLVVLVNNGSASASEIVAGAIKDNKRGLLVGVKTFGKGSVQSLIPVRDGKAALKLTTAKYYTPTGECIHEKGIEPDMEVPLDFSQMKDLHIQLSTVKTSKPTEGPEKESSSYSDLQLEKAIEAIKGMEKGNKQK
ncbi:MAG: S41 family peptidase [Planctomycetes bacterium]|nr:S41 family peptidase [Planctomycetota bacterium]